MLLLAWLTACVTEEVGVPLAAFDGKWTWSIEFDTDARAAGKEDCAYSRTYSGEEDRSVPWLCPECDVIYRATVGMTEEDKACYAQISSAPPEPVEWLGLGEDQWWRGGQNYLLGPVGTAVVVENRVTVDYTFPWKLLVAPELAKPGSFQLVVDGQADLVTSVGDPWHGHLPPETYACDWVDRNPPAYDGPWVLEEGKLLPDGAFLDRCDEALRLHDMVGSWLVIDIAAMDCGPCQTMAVESEAYLASLEQPLVVVTLLTESLTDPFLDTSRSDIDAWADAFNINMPVVRDRGYGFWLGYEHFGDRFGYPMTVVVGPDGRVRDMWVGYLGWERVQSVIDAG